MKYAFLLSAILVPSLCQGEEQVRIHVDETITPKQADELWKAFAPKH